MGILLAVGGLAVGALVGAKLLSSGGAAGAEAWWIFYSAGPTRYDKVTGVFFGNGDDGRQAALAKAKEWFDLRFGTKSPYFTAFVISIEGDHVTHAADLELVANQIEEGAVSAV